MTPLLEPANYKLTAEGPQHVEYSRRYVPSWLLVAASSLIVGAAVVNAVGDTEPAVALLGLLAALSLLLGRPRELLTVSIHPRPAGSTAVLTGCLNGRGRLALLGFDPPRGSRPPAAPRRHYATEGILEPPPAS